MQREDRAQQSHQQRKVQTTKLSNLLALINANEFCFIPFSVMNFVSFLLVSVAYMYNDVLLSILYIGNTFCLPLSF